MSSKKPARARAQNFANLILMLFAGSLLIVSLVVIRGNIGRDTHMRGLAISSLPPLLAPDAPEEAAEAKPSVYDIETALGSRVLMARWDPLIAEASRRFKLPEKWIRAVMRMESGGRTVLEGDTPITSSAGAVGIMQVMPGTYDEMRQQYDLGADPFDPRDNIFAGTAYLRWLHGKYGYPAMFAAYNNGPGNLENHLYRGRSLPTETRNYIAGIAKMLGMGATAKAAMAKFTRPDGTPVWIDSAKVSGVRAAMPGEFGDNVQAVINLGRKRQAVLEDLATATALLRDRNG